MGGFFVLKENKRYFLVEMLFNSYLTSYFWCYKTEAYVTTSLR